MPAGAKTLLASVVDYAGLFPPTSAPLADAVAHFAEQVEGPDRWMLGRFVLPATRLDAFAQARARVPGHTVWRLSAVIGADLKADAAAIAAFNTMSRTAIVDAMEVKAATEKDVAAIAARRVDGVATYVEVPLEHAEPLLAAIHAHGMFGKGRMGGVTADSIPGPRAVAAFIRAAVKVGVPFKCTAGLHHPLRGEYRLTYAPDAPRGAMFGYLNVLLATAAARADWPQREVESLLIEQSADSLAFDADGVTWRGRRLETAALDLTRANSLRSFGSCSFREPVDELVPIASRSA